MSETKQEMLDKCPVDGALFTAKAGKKVCSPKCKKKWDSENRRLRKAAIIAETDRKREERNARRRKPTEGFTNVLQLGGQKVACTIISRHFFGLFTKVKFPSQLDYGYPAFSETRTVASWRVK